VLYGEENVNIAVFTECGEFYLYDMRRVEGIVPVIRTDSRNGNAIKGM